MNSLSTTHHLRHIIPHSTKNLNRFSGINHTIKSLFRTSLLAILKLALFQVSSLLPVQHRVQGKVSECTALFRGRDVDSAILSEHLAES